MPNFYFLIQFNSSYEYVNQIIDSSLTTPLMLAVKNNNRDIVQLLLHQNASLNTPNSYGNTAIAMSMDEDMFELLLQNGAKISAAVLVEAITKGRQKVVELLLKNGVSQQNYCDGKNNLHYASFSGNPQMFKLLHQENLSSINTKDFMGYTPLMMAVRVRRHEDYIEQILVSGADIDMVNLHGNSALMIGADEWASEYLIEKLLEYKASLNIQNRKGMTALMLAVEKGNVSTVKLLLAAGAMIDLTNNEGKTAADIASELGRSEILKLLT